MSNEYEEQNDELSEVKADVSAANNAKQLNARMVIGRKSELARMKNLAEDGGEEMSGVDDGVPDDDPDGGLSDAYLVSDETIKQSLASLPKAEELVKPKVYKLKVNGKEVELSEEEMIARAQKVEAADQYLAEAKRQAEALRATAAAPPPAGEQSADTLSDEDLALARALQVGSEEEAAKAIRALRQKPGPAPSINMDALAQKVEADMDFKANAKWFQESYPELFADPDYMTLVLKRDQEMLSENNAKGIVQPYKDRYAKIGDEIRKKFGINVDGAAKTRRKQETLTAIPTAHTKVRMPAEEDDSEPDVRDTIAEMAKARGQRNLGV